MSLVIAIGAAALPTALYGLIVWWLDRYEKEPLGLILVAFLWGAIPAIALALLFEVVLAPSLDRSPVGPDVAANIAPLVEEPLKAVALVGLFLWARNEFDGPLDGIVYGALIGFGFSMTENALYFVHYGNPSALFWLRSVVFGLNHAFFTSIVGLAIGSVRYTDRRTLKLLAFAGGLALAILFHAVHNFFITASATFGLLLSWAVQSGGVLVMFAITALAWRNERRWMEQELGEEVRLGVLSIDEYREVASSVQRLRAQARPLFAGQWARFQQVRQFHHLVTELAFCKSKIRMADRYQPCDASDGLRGEIAALRVAMQREHGALSEGRGSHSH